MEDYSHREIADELNISENTSKTQLLKARRVLKNKLNEYYTVKKQDVINE
jgi:RNA polymerase sigma-70 factor (ECF subfamily)